MYTSPSSTQLGSMFLFILVASVAVGLCASAMVKKIKKRRIRTEEAVADEFESNWPDAVKKVLLRAVCWREESWVKEEGVAAKRVSEDNGGLVNTPPLWHRKILMGEKCEMPKFSGLILYDVYGRPLQSNNSGGAPLRHDQEKPAAAVTTLRDLL